MTPTIAVDAGALCTGSGTKFGTAIFTENLIRATGLYDKKHQYNLYGFKPLLDDIVLSTNQRYHNLQPTPGWMRLRVSLQELLHPSDVFLALNQAFPLTKARVLGWSHGLSFLKYPEYYPDSAEKMKRQLDTLVNRAKVVFVTSSRVKQELLHYYPHARVEVMMIGLPFDMMHRVRRERKKFFLFVGMNHPIKNTQLLIDAFKIFQKKTGDKNYRFVMIGDHWEAPRQSHQIHSFECTRTSLLEDYQTCAALLSGSHYESFNLPILEALSQNAKVIAMKNAVIPELTRYVRVTNTLNDLVDAMVDASQNLNNEEQTAQAVIKQFHWKNIIHQLITHYD
jgi:glycosyltransferase involved in cell wall biosynthesis